MFILLFCLFNLIIIFSLSLTLQKYFIKKINNHLSEKNVKKKFLDGLNSNK